MMHAERNTQNDIKTLRSILRRRKLVKQKQINRRIMHCRICGNKHNKRDICDLEWDTCEPFLSGESSADNSEDEEAVKFERSPSHSASKSGKNFCIDCSTPFNGDHNCSIIKMVENITEISGIRTKGTNSDPQVVLIPANELRTKLKELSKQFSGIWTANTLGLSRLVICCDDCVEIAPLSNFK